MATRAALSIGLVAAPIYKFLISLFRPIVWIVEKIIKESTSGLSNEMCVMSEEELKQLNELTRRPK